MKNAHPVSRKLSGCAFQKSLSSVKSHAITRWVLRLSEHVSKGGKTTGMAVSNKASIENLMTNGLTTGQVPNDSRHARQLVRRQQIAETVMAEGSMRIEDLTERFGISLMTAHRDVDELVSRGLFRKSRGIVSAGP
ncbi:DeoR family transcriptional regulator, partial [Brucella abortus]|uniref:DeoR family transcriptional regulator n=1 Tax=Brucella abortus TaxID=235 RepID=UPI001FFD9A5B